MSSRLVAIGQHVKPIAFEDSARRQRAELGVAAQAWLVAEADPARAGEPTRRVLRLKERRMVGYAMRVVGLTDEDSIRVQEMGLGSRWRMGCGVFSREVSGRADVDRRETSSTISPKLGEK